MSFCCPPPQEQMSSARSPKCLYLHSFLLGPEIKHLMGLVPGTQRFSKQQQGVQQSQAGRRCGRESRDSSVLPKPENFIPSRGVLTFGSVIFFYFKRSKVLAKAKPVCLCYLFRQPCALKKSAFKAKAQGRNSHPSLHRGGQNKCHF